MKRLLCESPGTYIRAVQDSFQSLRETKSKSVDVIITDPPYSAHVQKNMCSGSLVGKKSVPKYELPFPPLESYEWANELLRIAKRWVLVFCAVEDFGRYEEVAGLGIANQVFGEYIRGGIWYKPNAMGQLTKDRPATSYEGIAIMHPNGRKKEWNGKGSFGIWKANGTRGLRNRHPNEKPLDLCSKLVALFSNRGETVFDPFCGSAAIGEAAFSLGRNYIGWEKDARWVARSNLRLAEVEMKHENWALNLCRMNG